MDQLDYFKALLVRRPAYLERVDIPRIERELDLGRIPESKLAAFRQATQYPDNGYLPITFPHVAAFPAHFKNMLDARFPLRQTGIIHIRSKYLQLRPVGGGESLKALARIDGQRETDKGWEFDLTTELYVKDEKVWHGDATMLSRRPGGSTGKKTPPTPVAEAAGTTSDDWRATLSDARSYAWASGDLNPIHLSGVTARLFGFKQPLIHGMWSLSRIAGRHADQAAKPQCELYGEFKLPLLLPGKAMLKHWRDGQGVGFRLLDGSGEKPHVTGWLHSP